MFGGGLALQQHAISSPAVAAAVDWILPLGDVAAWLETAPIGARLLYGQGERLIRGATATRLREAQAAHLVDLFQPRSSMPGRFDFIVVKRAEPVREAKGSRVADPAMRVIFKRLVQAAKRGERCPGDKMLAELAGLSSVAKAKWRVRKLERSKAIRTRTVCVPAKEPLFRVVEILDEAGAVMFTTAGPEA